MSGQRRERLDRRARIQRTGVVLEIRWVEQKKKKRKKPSGQNEKIRVYYILCTIAHCSGVLISNTMVCEI